jgi:hypothetical protein
MANFPQIRLRKNGATLYMRLPLDFVRDNNLRPGDWLVPDLSTFKIIRQEDLATLHQEPVMVAAE